MEEPKSEKKTQNNWNRLSILSAVLTGVMIYGSTIFLYASFLAPVALVGGIYSYKQIKKTKEKGKWLSLIAIIFGGLGTFSMASSILLIAINPSS